MKKILVLSAFLFFTGWNISIAQVCTKTNPIPSFDFPLNNQTAVFQEQPGGTNEKRDVTVVITSTTENNSAASATVTLTNKATGEVYGPFVVSLDEKLVVTVGKGVYSAVVSTSSSVSVSIWTDKH